MGLAAAGEWAAVERCFSWLAANQLGDGSWCTFYVPDGVTEPRRDPNVCAYVATGAWWCSQLLGETADQFLRPWWPMVERAVGWCLRWQRPTGEFAWSVGPDNVPGRFALLAACSSLQQSLFNAYNLALSLGLERPEWAAASARAAEAVACRPLAFADKRRWAMDWYYPALSGALVGERARQSLQGRWDEFVVPGLGSRCVSDRPWVTAAETAECSMAAGRAGLGAESRQLLDWVSHLRAPSGAYWTGCVHSPECVNFPGGQLSTYSAAAVLIADHVLGRRSPAAELFSQSSPLAPPQTARAACRPEVMQAGTPTPS